MTAQALYLKWRPQKFDQIIGQDHVTRTLQNALATDRVAHAYLLAGPRGTGKTSTARLLAKAVNCVGEGDEKPCGECHICLAVEQGRLMDLIEIDAASNRGIDEMRDLRDKVGFRPSEARIKFYIIDEVHMLTKEAFNALLKTLEEPPEHVIFVLATTEPHKIPATIISRCQRFDFRRISLKDMNDWLGHIAENENLDVDPQALEYIARQGGGSLRDSISLLDQLTAYGSQTITLAQVQTVLGSVASESVVELVDHLLEGNVAGGLDLINRLVGDGTDVRQFTRESVEYLRRILLLRMGPGVSLLRASVSEVELANLQEQTQRVDDLWLLRTLRLFNDAALDMKTGFLPQLPLEMAFVESLVLPEDTPAQTTPPASAPAAQSVPSVPPAPAQSAGPSSTSPVQPEIPAPLEPSPPAAQPEPASVTQETSVEYGSQKAGPSVSGGLTLESVQAQWREILSRLRQADKMAQSLMNSVVLVGVEGNAVIVEAQSDLIRGQIEKASVKEFVEPCISQVMGVPARVRCVVKGEYQAQTAPGTTSTSSIPDVAQPLQAGQVKDTHGESENISQPGAESDPVLGEAMGLGGIIRDEES